MITSILDAEIKARVAKEVKYEVEKAIKEAMDNLPKPRKLKLQKAENKDVGGLIELLTNPDISLISLNLEFTGRTDLETWTSFKKEFKEAPIRSLVNTCREDNLAKMDDWFLKKGFHHFTDLDVRVKFKYNGDDTSKMFYIVDTTTDMESIKIQLRRLRDLIVDQIPEYVV